MLEIIVADSNLLLLELHGAHLPIKKPGGKLPNASDILGCSKVVYKKNANSHALWTFKSFSCRFHHVGVALLQTSNNTIGICQAPLKKNIYIASSHLVHNLAWPAVLHFSLLMILGSSSRAEDTSEPRRRRGAATAAGSRWSPKRPKLLALQAIIFQWQTWRSTMFSSPNISSKMGPFNKDHILNHIQYTHTHSDNCIQLTQLPRWEGWRRTARWKSQLKQYG